MRSHPEIGHRRVPRTGYRTQGGQEDMVYRARDGVEYDEGDEEEGDVVGNPRKGEGGEWFHSDEWVEGVQFKNGEEFKAACVGTGGGVGGRPGKEGGQPLMERRGSRPTFICISSEV